MSLCRNGSPEWPSPHQCDRDDHTSCAGERHQFEELAPLNDAPLADITVVSLEQAVAAPYATRQLADLGARVVKVERPQGGDFARSYDEAVHGNSSYFVWLNRAKESLTLDVKSEMG